MSGRDEGQRSDRTALLRPFVVAERKARLMGVFHAGRVDLSSVNTAFQKRLVVEAIETWAATLPVCVSSRLL